MNIATIYLGDNLMKCATKVASGGYVQLYGEDFYKISDVDQIRPFFMSIVSDSDHWMFLSSNGALTAGRKSPQHALFPYYTVDKIHDSAEITGSKTIIRVGKNDRTFLWEPFSERYTGLYIISRNLYKNIPGNKIVFEEINLDLKIAFRYFWCNSDRFGFVKRSEIENLQDSECFVEVLDGIQNILPSGVNPDMQHTKSNLVDAYRKSEMSKSGMGIFQLSSIPVDRAEPSEALRATTVWSVGEDFAGRLLSSIQLNRFRRGEDILPENDIRAHRGAYFVQIRRTLKSGCSNPWYIVAEGDQSSAKVADLEGYLENGNEISAVLESDIAEGTRKLIQLVSCADGIQYSNDRLSVHRHFENVLFNTMRGGIFANGYLVKCNDLIKFIQGLSKEGFEKCKAFLDSLPNEIHYTLLKQKISSLGNAFLIRAVMEYLPLTFSRRHGDPSRPWNTFSIETKDAEGNKILNYQGNWRDIFQNWEALCISYPGFIESVIHKFVNASTFEGYNPYRVTRDGFDWEIHDPTDPWSFIGYWGDHQVIYLLRFLELASAYYPGMLEKNLVEDLFVFANIPYKIKSYPELLSDPHHTILYDKEAESAIHLRIKEIGSDGKLLNGKSGEILKVNLTEKLLIVLLGKLVNFIPDGGIWMNTQRPEWNDANNALVGNGVSMVTLYYMRRYVHFFGQLLKKVPFEEVMLSIEVSDLLNSVQESFQWGEDFLKTGFTDVTRRDLVNRLGLAGSAYRETVYQNCFSGKRKMVPTAELCNFLNLTLKYLNKSIEFNLTSDNLYHSYNILKIQENELQLKHLSQMLEGQVAVLSSGKLSLKESLDVLSALKNSPMFWQEEYSYRLYPDKELPRFIQKNNIPLEIFSKSELLQKLVADGISTVVEKDYKGGLHFSGTFTNKHDLGLALLKLDTKKYAALVLKEKEGLLDVFEKMFDHDTFTGRSGTFYGYEGLGCIYWHMVSKLMVAVAEICELGENEKDSIAFKQMRGIYFDIRKGLGLNKSPDQYMAFPADPYSHTPGHRGAQQPGMTGQVKEDIITRFAELGIRVRNGKIHFSNAMLRSMEFLPKEEIFHYVDVRQVQRELNLESGSLAFTFCQVPIIYHFGEKEQLTYVYNGKLVESDALVLDESISNSVFERTAEVQYIDVIFNYLPMQDSF